MFFLLAVIEDSGYISRIAFVLDRVLRTFGLQGKSILAMIVSGILASGPNAVHEAKRLVHNVSYKELTDFDLEAELAVKIADLRTKPEGQEGMSAFLEKRKPNWVEDA